MVTAQKREDNVQEVPISIQAFSDESLGARNVQSVQDLDQLVPSLHFTQAAGYLLLYIRGIGTDNFVLSADPSIATYLDGIYIPQTQVGAQSLGNIERVEVLKGPQGTLFGRNAIGGAINVVTKVPGDEFAGSAEAAYSRFNHRSVKASVSGPLTDWLSASAAGILDLQDNYIQPEDYDYPTSRSRTGRLKVNFHPTDDFSVDLTVFRADQRNANLAVGSNTEPSLLGSALGIQPAPDDYTTDNDLQALGDSRQNLYYGNVTWNAPWVDIKLLGSVQRLTIDTYQNDFDGSNVPLIGFVTYNEYAHLRTGELQFISNDDTLWSDKFKWVFGLVYFHSVVAYDPVFFNVAPQALKSGAGLIGVTLPEGLTDLFDRVPIGPTPLGNNGISLALNGALGTDSYSAYTQGTYEVNDWLDLTLGGRYQYEKRFLTKATTSAVSPLSLDLESATLVPLLNYDLQEAEEYNFSPKAQISVHPRENALIYGSYTVGYKSGTYNIVNIYTPPKYIVPERVSTYEIGAKVDFLDGNLRVNGALFDNRIKNLQSGFVSLLSGGAVQFFTAPAARTRGVEFDALAVPFPEFDEGLALTANAAYVNARYTDYANGVGFQEGTGIYSQNLDFTGNKIPNAPRISGGVGFVQTFNVPGGTLEIAADQYFNRGFYYDAGNTVREAPYSITNARISYAYSPYGLRLTVFGQNLTDHRYHVQQFLTDFGRQSTLAPPRVLGLRLNYDF